MKNKLTWFFWLAVIGGAAWYFMHRHQTQGTAETQQQQKDAGITALALKYNAVTNWEAALPDRGGSAQLFSLDVSRALIHSNGQPVLIIMDLTDVQDNGGIYSAVFSKDDFSNGTFLLNLGLNCTPGQANDLLKKSGANFSQTYAVVVRLDEVRRPRIRLRVGGDGEGERVEIDSDSIAFFGRGELLDAVQLP